ncbi:sterol desaturase family protein [Stella sp.]|uniref:sterol desaturase family protein n=1 Tax=Stella sp. TaxID=2912054 RepID=UPI0035AF8748
MTGVEPGLAGFGETRSALPLAAAGLALLEYLVCRAIRHDAYDLGETAASFAIQIVQRLLQIATAGLVVVPLAWAYDLRIFTITMDGALPWAALLLGVEAAYYLHHRVMHRVRLLWAVHSVHHSPTRLNLSAAIRIGWFGPVTGGILFYLPLVVLGFPPLAVLGMLGLNLFYQLFLHTAWTPDLGPLEWVLNTPRHHHVHHAVNRSCLDRNFGGMLILFDRLFGTFAPTPAEPLRFGTGDDGRPSRNPLAVNFREWGRLAGELRRCRGIGQGFTVLFGRP